MGIYIGDSSSKARKIKNIFIGGSNNLDRKVKAVYIGDVNGVARLVWQSVIAKVNKYASFIFNKKIYASGLTVAGTPFKWDENDETNYICSSGYSTTGIYNYYNITRNSDGSINSFRQITDTGTAPYGRCRMGNSDLFLLSYKSENSYMLKTVYYSNGAFRSSTQTSELITDLISVDNTHAYGVAISSSNGVYLCYVTLYEGGVIDKVEISYTGYSATSAKLIKVSGSQHILVLNNIVVPLIYNNFNSYSLGSSVSLGYDFGSAYSIHVIDSSHVFIYGSKYGSSTCDGLQIVNNVISINSLSITYNNYTNPSSFCRVGKTNCFFAMTESYEARGTLVYYDTNSNKVSVICEDTKPTSVSSQRPEHDKMYVTLLPRGEQGIVALESNTDENYVYEYFLEFTV